MKTRQTQPKVSEIRLEGHLDTRWASSPVADQAALHGLLKKVRDRDVPPLPVRAGAWSDDHSKKSEINHETEKP